LIAPAVVSFSRNSQIVRIRNTVNALHLAHEMGVTKPLRDFVKAGKSVPHAQVFVAGESIPMRVLVADLLGDHHQQQEQRSRPHRVPSEAPAAAQAERSAALLVAFAQKGWRKRNGRKRVPGVVTNEMIKVAIEEAAKTFKVPVSAIYASNIRNLLKNRQVVVRNWRRSLNGIARAVQRLGGRDARATQECRI
jgi:hypothetical protein